VVVNPFDPSVLWVYHATRNRGGFLGIAKRDQRISRADVDAANRKHGRVNERMTELMASVKKRHSNRTTEATERKDHNIGVATAAQRTQNERTKQATAALMASISSDHDNTHNAPNNTDEINPRHLW